MLFTRFKIKKKWYLINLEMYLADFVNTSQNVYLIIYSISRQSDSIQKESASEGCWSLGIFSDSSSQVCSAISSCSSTFTVVIPSINFIGVYSSD